MGKFAIWVAVFMLFGSCLGISGLPGIKEFVQKCKTWIGCPTSLDMAPNSVDDMYKDCEKNMKDKVKKNFLLIEQNQSKNFQPAWCQAEDYYNNMKSKETSTLEKEQIMALHAYTLDEPQLYADFNKAVRTQKSEYKAEKFPYYTLHFYLTMALQTLKPSAENCVTVYRRSTCNFSQNILNKEIRFGAFTSTSMDNYSCNEMFGDQSCFEIYTCFGADISRFSKFKSEKEVLIPPYEVFKVIDIKKRSKLSKLPCKVVYKLQSTKRTLSNLNCSLFKNKLLPVFN